MDNKRDIRSVNRMLYICMMLVSGLKKEVMAAIYLFIHLDIHIFQTP